MNKYGILAVCFLAMTSVSSVVMAQVPPPPKDVAQLLYQLFKQQMLITKAYKNLKSASDSYIDDPTDANRDNLKAALDADLKVTVEYQSFLATNQQAINNAEKLFYEETPALKPEIEQGPTAAPEESVEKRMGESEQRIEQDLTSEVEQHGGGQSAFALALQKQATQLQSLQTRIAKEQSSPVVQSNPTASKQDRDLQSALSDAIEARMSVFFCANNPDECCKKYPNNPKCRLPKPNAINPKIRK